MKELNKETPHFEFKTEENRDSQGRPVNTRHLINGDLVVFIGSQPISVQTKWTEPQFIKGDFLPLKGFPRSAQAAKWEGKLIENRLVNGYLVKTADTQEVWKSI